MEDSLGDMHSRLHQHGGGGLGAGFSSFGGMPAHSHGGGSGGGSGNGSYHTKTSSSSVVLGPDGRPLHAHNTSKTVVQKVDHRHGRAPRVEKFVQKNRGVGLGPRRVKHASASALLLSVLSCSSRCVPSHPPLLHVQVTETHQAYEDSATGMRKVAVERTIGGSGHKVCSTQQTMEELSDAVAQHTFSLCVLY